MFFSVIEACFSVIDALIPTFMIFITANFINSVIAMYNGDVHLSSVNIDIALFVAVIIYQRLNDVIKNYVECKRRIYYRRKLVPEMLERRAMLEYQHYEDSKTLDLINRVCPLFDEQVWDMYKQIISLISLVIYVMGILITLFFQLWWIALSMLVLSIPIIYIATKAGQRTYSADKELTKIERRVEYLSEVMKSREAVEERTVYNYTEALNEQYAENYNFASHLRLKVLRRNIIKQKSGGIVVALYSIGAMLALIIPVTRGDIDFGMFVALTGAVFNLSDRLSWGVNSIFSDLAKKREYLKELTDFMNLSVDENSILQAQKNITFNVLEFKNIRFKYPGTNKIILDGVSFKIEKGKRYSFVGINGAGKTTITKLITGLYNNYEGEILVDGRSLRDFTQSEIKGLSAVVYQDFAKYYISMYDNIAIADIANYGDYKIVEETVKLMGLENMVSNLSDKLDTPLGKVLHNGVDLSGGEWQRTAMARCVINSAPLKILDEPTASLDPLGESMVYHSFDEISKGATTIFISHRLGSTKLADVIFVLSDGKIIENGSHSELVKMSGAYSKMYASQVEWYKDELKVVNGHE